MYTNSFFAPEVLAAAARSSASRGGGVCSAAPAVSRHSTPRAVARPTLREGGASTSNTGVFPPAAPASSPSSRAESRRRPRQSPCDGVNRREQRQQPQPESNLPAAPSPNRESTLHFRDRFTVERELSKALLGRVVKCRDRVTGRSVAVKEIDLALARRAGCNVAQGRQGSVKEDVDIEREVMRSLRVCDASGASRHANLLASDPLSEAASSGDKAYIVMPLADCDLYSLVDKEGGLEESVAVDYFLQLVDGLSHMHNELGLTHRDISLENIFMMPIENDSGAGEKRRLRPVIADFGLTLAMGDDEHRTAHRRVGKLGYMSPETYNAARVAGGAPDDGRADVWSLGVVLVTMLTGVPPYVRPDDSRNAKLRDRRYVEIAAGRLAKMYRGWGHTHVADAAYDLCQRLMTVDADARITLEEIREHPFVRTHLESLLAKPNTAIRGRSEDDFVMVPHRFAKGFSASSNEGDELGDDDDDSMGHESSGSFDASGSF